MNDCTIRHQRHSHKQLLFHMLIINQTEIDSLRLHVQSTKIHETLDIFLSLMITSCHELPGASSSAAFAVFNSTEMPQSKLAASSHPLLCPMHLQTTFIPQNRYKTIDHNGECEDQVFMVLHRKMMEYKPLIAQKTKGFIFKEQHT